MVADRTNEMFPVPALTERLDRFATNRLTTSMAALAEFLEIVSFAIRIASLFKERLMVETAMAYSAGKVLAMPLMSERFDELAGDLFFATIATNHGLMFPLSIQEKNAATRLPRINTRNQLCSALRAGQTTAPTI